MNVWLLYCAIIIPWFLNETGSKLASVGVEQIMFCDEGLFPMAKFSRFESVEQIGMRKCLESL